MDHPDYPQWTGSEHCLSTDPEAFFDDTFDPNETRKLLRQICGTCPSLEPCRNWGIKHEHYGWWGGMSAAERRDFRRKYNIQLDTPLGQCA